MASDGRTALGSAARTNDIPALQAALASSPPVNAHDKYGWAPLHYAAEEGHVEVVRLLLDAHARIDGEEGATTTTSAEQTTPPPPSPRTTKRIRVLTRMGKTSSGSLLPSNSRSPLHRAARKGFTEIIALMVEAASPADLKRVLDQGGISGRTPLHLAAAGGHLDAVRALLSAGASIDAPDLSSAKHTPLSLAIHSLLSPKSDSPSPDSIVTVAALLIVEGADVEKVLLPPLSPTPEAATLQSLIEMAQSLSSPDRTTLLISAAKNGDLGVVSALLNVGLDVDTVDSHGRAPVFWAAQNGHDDVASALIAAGADVHLRDAANTSPLHTAAVHDQYQVATMLIQQGARVDEAVDGFESTLLHRAASSGRAAIVSALIAAGAAVDKRNLFGTTALHMAAERGHQDVVSVLLQAGTDIKAVDTNGRTPLTLAACSGQAGVVAALIKAGAALSKPDVSGKTAMFLAAEAGYLDVVTELYLGGEDVHHEGTSALHYAAQEGHKDVALFLVEAGAHINALDTNGQTPLHLACWRNQTSVIPTLLSSGASADIVDSSGRTPLSWASERGYLDVVRSLIEHRTNGSSSTDIDIDGSNQEMWTPLHFAAKNNHLEVVNELLRAQADVNARTIHRETPLTLSARKGYTSVVSALVAAGARPDTNLVWRVLDKGDADILALLLSSEKGVDVNTPNDRGQTLLQAAVQAGKTHASCVAALIDAGADTNVRDGEGRHPLHLAVDLGTENVVRTLLFHRSPPGTPSSTASSSAPSSPHGLDLNAVVSLDGSTPLHRAVYGGNEDVVRALLDGGADIDKADATGNTPLHLAVASGAQRVMYTLLQAGASLSAKNADGWTPVKLAQREEQTEIAAFLREAEEIQIQSLHSACSDGHLHSVRRLYQIVKKPSAVVGPDGTTLLGTALIHGWWDIAYFLLSQEYPEETTGNACPPPEDPVWIHLRSCAPGAMLLLLDHPHMDHDLALSRLLHSGVVPTLQLVLAHAAFDVVTFLKTRGSAQLPVDDLAIAAVQLSLRTGSPHPVLDLLPFDAQALLVRAVELGSASLVLYLVDHYADHLDVTSMYPTALLNRSYRVVQTLFPHVNALTHELFVSTLDILGRADPPVPDALTVVLTTNSALTHPIMESDACQTSLVQLMISLAASDNDRALLPFVVHTHDVLDSDQLFGLVKDAFERDAQGTLRVLLTGNPSGTQSLLHTHMEGMQALFERALERALASEGGDDGLLDVMLQPSTLRAVPYLIGALPPSLLGSLPTPGVLAHVLACASQYGGRYVSGPVRDAVLSNPATPSSAVRSVLLRAAAEGDSETVASLVVGRESEGVWEALVTACFFDHRPVVDVLLDLCLNQGQPEGLEELTRENNLVLHLLCARGYSSAVESLVSHKFVQKAPGSGDAFVLAARCGHTSVVEHMLGLKVEKHEMDLYHQTRPYLDVAEHEARAFRQAMVEGKQGVVDALAGDERSAEAFPDLSHPGHPVYLAARSGNEEETRRLLEIFGDSISYAAEGDTHGLVGAAEVAATHGWASILRLLLTRLYRAVQIADVPDVLARIMTAGVNSKIVEEEIKEDLVVAAADSCRTWMDGSLPLRSALIQGLDKVTHQLLAHDRISISDQDHQVAAIAASVGSLVVLEHLASEGKLSNFSSLAFMLNACGNVSGVQIVLTAAKSALPLSEYDGLAAMI